MTKTIPFFQAFAKLPPEGLSPEVASWPVIQTAIQKESRSLTVTLGCPPPPSQQRDQVQQALALAYRLSQVTLEFSEAPQENPAPEAPPVPVQEAPPIPVQEAPPVPVQKAPEETAFERTERMRREALLALQQQAPQGKQSQGKKGPKGESAPKMVIGKAIKREILPISDLELDMGMVAVEGTVFALAHHELKRNNNAWIIAFDITDYTSSVRVHKFMPKEEAAPILSNIKKGMRVQVQGRLNIDRFYNDMVLEPYAIAITAREIRKDTAEKKRVELHLHSNMSQMDALTSVSPKDSAYENVVKRAESWGHPAIALTDHGIAHSFPDAWHSAKDIKILYGTEAYFINDIDDNVVVEGDSCQTFQEEIVCFDLETTGLSAKRDLITEIGAVVLKNGEVVETFQTFADPKRYLLPEIIQLTGITDEMLKGAPSQEEALGAFVEFVAGRPLAAHNVPFDMGFVRAGCDRYQIPLTSTVVDTLVLSQNLLPHLKKHKLNLVANHLNLPEFNHHRATDDASVVAEMLKYFWRNLEKLGLSRLDEINEKMKEYRPLRKGKQRNNHLIVLAKNQVGLRNLYKLISLSHLDHFDRKQKVPVMPKSLIQKHREGLILGSACEAGELFRGMVSGKSFSDLQRIASWYDYLEIQPLCNNHFLIRSDRILSVENEEDLKDLNRTVIALGKSLDKPVCATGDVHFLDPEEEIYRQILSTSKGYADADQPLPLYFRTTQEMLEEFSYLGKELAEEVVITNTNLVADWCDVVDPLPKGLFTPTLERSQEELTSLVWGKVAELYGDQPPQLVKDRVTVELTDIIDRKYDVIYMSAQKLVQDSLAHGYLVGSRGSVGSSIVAFMSGITEVNSLPGHYRCPKCKHSDFDYGVAHDLGCGADFPDQDCPNCGTPYEKDGFNIPFETFLGFGGAKVPDIDLNFSGEYQANAHRYTFELFGENHVFRSGTVGKVAEKTAYGHVKKFLEKQGLSLSKAEENRLTAGCTGVKRTSGQHPGGMIVIPQDKEIYDFCPVQRPADDPDSDIITTHFEYHAMEDNLLKLDILGHDDPSMIRMMQDLTGIDPQKIHLDDQDTMSLFCSSKALGFENDNLLGPTGAVAIPEFGTKFVREMLLDTQPSQFDILVRLSGFSHGTDVWLGNAKDLITSGTATVREAIGCRDDIMLYLIARGMDEQFAFKIMEMVRKGKGLPEGAEDQMKALEVPQWYIDSCKKIAYLFPKAHAVAYVMMAFRIAWFKVHRPLAFYAAYFTIRAKAFDQKYMCRGMDVCRATLRKIAQKIKDKEASNVEIEMFTTLEVCYEFYLRGFTFRNLNLYDSHTKKFLVEEEQKVLIPPFTSVAGLGEAAAESLVEQREGRTFISIEEVADSCPKVSKTHIQQLTDAGAFGNLPATSQLDLFSMLS